MLLISLSQTKPSTFEMIFPSHPDIALNQLVSPQRLRLVLLVEVLKISTIYQSRVISRQELLLWVIFHIPPLQPLTFWGGGVHGFKPFAIKNIVYLWVT